MTTSKNATTSAPATSPTPKVESSNAAATASVLLTPVTVAQRLMPASPVPVVLATGALVLAGVVELPIAGALGLGYLALRRWHPNR